MRFVGIERHVPRVGPVCDFIQICSERRSCCLLVWGMTYGMADGGVISKEIKRIFQRVGEIIGENEKMNMGQNAALRHSSVDRKRG